MIIYSVLIGNYDDFDTKIPPCNLGCDARYILITDQIDASNNDWEIRYVDKAGDPFIESRRYKIIPNSIFKDFNIPTLYIDANVKLQKCPCSLFRTYEMGKNLVVPAHPFRNCVYEETSLFLKNTKYHLIAQDVLRFYNEISFPKQYGLTENGIFIIDRSITKNCLLFEDWFNLVNRFRCRDQFLLMPMIRQHGAIYQTLAEGPRNSKEFFRLKPHISEQVSTRSQRLRYNIRSAPNASYLNKFLSKLLRVFK